MNTLIHPTYHRAATFTDVENPDIIISQAELVEAIDALDGNDPDLAEKVKKICARQVPIDADNVTALWLMGKVPSTMPVFTYDPVEAKYNHLQRMVSGEITTVEYDEISKRIDEETAEQAA